MSGFVNIDSFIRDRILMRPESLFRQDIIDNAAELKKVVEGSRVLVIGGAGTIGSSYIKAILPFRPAALTVLDLSENGLTELIRDLRSQEGLYVPDDMKLYPVNFSDEVAKKIIDTHGPYDIIAHFAAHKHVRSEKDVFSIEAMYRNNVVNNLKLIQHIRQNPPEHFFCVSTDKAANPVNVMGATKRIMEDLLMSYANEMKITTARFANVAFSNGSLLDGFTYRMSKGQPLAAPKGIKRYFVAPIESGELCLLTSICGDSGQIFFPKLEESQMMTFTDIAEKYLDVFGYKPLYCATEDEARVASAAWVPGMEEYPVLFFDSDTSGEKSFEEFYTQSDSVDMDRFKSIGVISNPTVRSRDEVLQTIAQGESLFSSADISKSDVIAWINSVLPNFDHIETGKNLDQRM